MSERIVPGKGEQNILKEKLLALCPEIFQDGKLNVEALQTLLPDELEDEEQQREHFGLNWPGKTRARQLALQKPVGSTLKPCPGEGVNEEATQNVFIEGDNLEVLKLLREAYSDQVKMIYIDPPYNTGNDFVYKDSFEDSVEDYLAKTGQKDGKTLLVANPKAAGRFHSNWLNFMLPRLRIAKDLMKETGVIFVSIGSDEVSNLKAVMNEVFGEENFIGEFVWQSKKGGGSDSGGIVSDHEYVLCFGNSTVKSALSRVQIVAEELDKTDAIGQYRRGRELNKWGANSRREDRPTMWFSVPGPNSEQVFPIRNDGSEGCWRFGKKKMDEFVSKGNAEFVRRDDGTYIAYEKIRTTDPRTKPYRTYLSDTGTTADGSKTVKEIFEGNKVFDFAKPVKLLKQLISIGATGDEIILDFFAGSGTTAQAVMELNAEQELNLSYVCVQLPESIDSNHTAYKLGYRTVSQITKDRLRKVSNALVAKGGDDSGLGFAAYELAKSNFNVTKSYVGSDVGQLTIGFQQATDKPLVEGWTKADLTTEIMLLEGFPLHSRQEPQVQLMENEVVAITSDFNANTLYVCLDAQMQDDTVEALALGREDVLVCLDDALTDLQKVRLDDKLTLKTV
ncbi:site-specific DNA-methyltransferase [Hymenobacter setariae]|uniref:site-specific DNA-methyltransferase (adenine-specific) n=1 Tax=Hymenobacter setariae TaxID=2594794 RepID=A0A558BJQ5_9BACT|nr:site-specific DNA-methyltransferase [Hymenobacter setariae]TVT36751.1 site-specific DNA-methyltransferase [Hymenobacter setariae]